MADRIAGFDWATTPLGPREQWPQSLRTAVDLMLALPQPGYIGWGPTLVSLYNDAYVPVLGTKHPDALGRSYFDVWSEIDAAYRAALDATLAGEARMFVDEAMPLAGRGRDTSWFTFSWTPLRDDDGKIAGFLTVGMETSDKVVAEHALQESEVLARTLLGALAQAAWETGPDGLVSVDSPSWRAYTGQTVDEWMGWGWLDAVHPDDRDYARRQWTEAVDASTPVDAEFRMRRADGGWHWTNVRAVPLLDGDGRVRKWVGMNIDVDVRRRMEIARAEADERRRVGEARLRAAVEASGVGTWVWYPAADTSECDEYTCALLGYPAGSDLTLARVVRERLHPDDAEDHVARLRAALDGVDDGRVAHDFRIVLPDGAIRWIAVRARVLRDAASGDPQSMVGTLEDVTARKRHEADLAFLAEFERRLAAGTEPDEIARDAAEAVAAYVGAPHAFLVDIEPEIDVAHIYWAHSPPGARDLRGDYRLAEFHSPDELARLHAGVPVVLSDVRADCTPSRAAEFEAHGIHALATLPCIRDGRWIFALSVQYDAPHGWIAADVDLLRQLVERLWLRLERARTDAARREHEAQQAFLLALADVLRPLSDPHMIQGAATRLLREHLDTGWCHYAEFDETTAESTVLADAVRPGLPSLVGVHRVEDSRFFDAVRGGELLEVPDYAASSLFTAAMVERYTAAGLRSLLCAPLIKDGRPVAALMLSDTEAHPWSDRAKRLIVEVAERTWAATERARADAAREAATAALARQTRFIEGMLGSLPDYAYAFDREHRFAYTNRAMQALFVRTADEMAGRNFADLGYPTDLAAHLDAQIDHILRTGETVEDEVFYVAPDGTAAYFAYLWGPVRDAQGCVELVVGTSRDTTARRQLEERLRTSEAHQAFRVRIADTLRDIDDPLRIQAEANRLLAAHLGAQRVLFAQVEGEEIVVEHDHVDGVPSIVGRYPASAFGRAYPEIYGRGEMFMVDDVARDPRVEPSERDVFQQMGIGAFASGGIREDGRVAAILSVHVARPRAWTHDEAMLVREVGERAWSAIKRARAEQALRQRQRRDAFLLHLSDRLRRLGDPAQLQSEAARTLGEFLGAARVIYGEVLDDGEMIRVAHSFVAPGVARLEGDLRMLDFGADVIATIRRGETVLMDAAATDARLNAVERAAYEIVPVGSHVGVPLIKDGRLAAVLAVHTVGPHAWSPEDVQLIEDTAERTWEALNRARAETALQDSERRLAAIFSTASVGLSEIDPAGRFVRVNDEFCRLLGRPREALLGMPVLDATHPDDVERTLETIDRARDEGGTVRTEKRYLRADGRVVWAESSVTPFRTYNGLPGNLLAVTVDLTERRTAEAAREASEQLLRQFSEASADVLWIRDAETLRWDYLSPAYAQVYGEPVEVALDVNELQHWADHVLDEDRDHAIACMDRVRAGEQVTFEYRIRRVDDGAVRWVRDTDFPILDADGRVQRIGGIGHDVTDLKRVQAALAESEHRLRALMEGIPQLVWRSLEGGDWTWSSPQWQDFTGQTAAQSLRLGWLDAVHPDDRDAALSAWTAAQQTAQLDVELRLRRAADGAWIWHHTRSLPQPTADGAVVEWFGTCTDVQQLKRLQEQQQVLVAELQHRTRNLIGVVRSIAERTIAGSTSTAEFREQFRDRMAALARVQGLLSQRDAGQRITFDQLLGAELGGLGVLDRTDQLVLDGPEGIPLRSGTVQTFALGLHELATNAVKYGALAGTHGRLEVRWSVEDDPHRGDMLCVHWRESGVHVPEERRGGPGRRGYGRELIERALPYQLQAETAYELREDGVRCTLRVPLKSRSDARPVPHV